MIPEFNPDDLRIVPLKQCSELHNHLRKGIDRLIQGPIDSCVEGKIHPIDMISNNQNYFVMEHTLPDSSRIVGYVYLQRHQSAISTREFHIYEFEIFREYRGKHYGKYFLEKIHDYESFHEGYAKVCMKYLNVSKFLYIWKHCPMVFFDPFDGEFIALFESMETLEQDRRIPYIRAYIESGNHTKLVGMLMEQILLYMNQYRTHEYDKIKEFVKSLYEWKAMQMHFEKSKCIVCTTRHTYLWITTCGNKEHLICDVCIKEIEQRKGSCPNTCKNQPIVRESRIHTMNDERESLIWCIV